MDNADEERYVSLRLADSDMDEVTRVIESARAQESRRVQVMLIRCAVVAYSRPFKLSQGVFKRRFRPITAEDIPALDAVFHERVMRERDTRIAHGDISEYKPELHYWTKDDFFPVLLRGTDFYGDLTLAVNKLEVLARETKQYIQMEMKRMENVFRAEISKSRRPNPAT